MKLESQATRREAASATCRKATGGALRSVLPTQDWTQERDLTSSMLCGPITCHTPHQMEFPPSACVGAATMLADVPATRNPNFHQSKYKAPRGHLVTKPGGKPRKERGESRLSHVSRGAEVHLRLSEAEHLHRIQDENITNLL